MEGQTGRRPGSHRRVGAFDEDAGDYADTVVVFAHFTG
jgi:hypothetical protein